MMGFEAPALLLLLAPVGLLYVRRLRPPGAPLLRTMLHATLLIILVAGTAGPYLSEDARAVDLIVVVDRSRSMPPESEGRIRELIELIERQRVPGMRLGIVTAGASAQIERIPQDEGRFAGFSKPVDPDGSNLAEGIETAVTLVGAGRSGRVLVFSDGLATGRSPLGTASLAASRGVAVDYRLFRRPALRDTAIERIQLPPETDAGATFQWSAWIRSDRDAQVTYRCFRDEVLIARGEMAMKAGSRPIFFRDRLPPGGGLHRYRVEVVAPDDAVPENNTATAVLRAHAAPRLLVATSHPQEDNLTRALKAAGFQVDRVRPEEIPRDPAGLDLYRAVVLEDVPAGLVGAEGIRSLRAFVEELGGGLLMTGGPASFGVGGWFKSDLDPILPVSMEMRQEQRRFRLAMAIVLDRSGSMAAPVGGGLQKMDLANRGTAEAIGMLSPQDEVAVIAVDSSPHVIVPLTKNKDPGEIQRKVLRIRSEGGGIFTYTALLAAARALEGAEAATRHIVLFADAADAEEPGEYRTLLPKLTRAGVTVSVIGLGTEKDSDADFLKDVARLGNGRIFFTDKPEDLPRLFAQETLSVARSSFVDEPAAARWKPDARLLGEVALRPLPSIGGYNLAYLRPEAAMGAATEDEHKAPVLAFWHRGTGRAAAFTPEADGRSSGPLLAWPGYGALWAGLGRWLMGDGEPPGVSVVRRVEEPDVLFTLEYDPESEAGREIARTPPALKIVASDGSAPAPIPFQWTGERTLEARMSMKREGIYLPLVRLASGRQVKVAPVMLPYSPEFLPRRGGPEEGRELLGEIAARTGGRQRESMDGIFEMERAEARERRSLRAAFALAALLLLLLDVAARRLRLWESAWILRVGPRMAELFHRMPVRAAAAPSRVVDAAPPSVAPAEPPPPPEPPSALDAAKEKARRRFGDR